MLVDKIACLIQGEAKFREQAISRSLWENLCIVCNCWFRVEQILECFTRLQHILIGKQSDFISQFMTNTNLLQSNQRLCKRSRITCIKQVDNQLISIRVRNAVIKKMAYHQIQVHIAINTLFSCYIQQHRNVWLQLTTTWRECLLWLRRLCISTPTKGKFTNVLICFL